MQTKIPSGSIGSVSAGALLTAALAAPVAGQLTERVSVDSLGAQGNRGSLFPSISADGRCVAFDSFSTNLVSGDTNGRQDVYVHDRQSRTTELVSINSFGGLANRDCSVSSISADGRYVAFSSGASNLVTGDTNVKEDVFIHDRQGGATERVSVDSFEAQGNDNSYNASISADGRYVAFDSFATNFVSGDTNLFADVFVRDRQSGTTDRVSVSSSGAQGNGGSIRPSISADGRYVGFLNFPSISADGRYVAFDSLADNLVSGDTNLAQDIFLRDTCGSAATSATFAGDGINADTITPVNAVLGSSWSAPLTIGHPHGAGGPLVLKLRSATINGPNIVSPMGGRPTELLIAGPLLGTISGSHNGASGDIAPQVIPDQLSLVGTPWAAQYTVVGGGFADLSQAVSGVVGCP